MYKLFTFYKHENDSQCIHVVSSTLMEAANAVYELDNFSSMHYNFREYKLENINAYEYLNIEPEYWELPYILTNKEYDYVIKEHNKNNNVSKIVRNVLDQSAGEKYNTAIPLNKKFNNTAKDCLDRIKNANKNQKVELIDEKCKIELNNEINSKKDGNTVSLSKFDSIKLYTEQELRDLRLNNKKGE